MCYQVEKLIKEHADKIEPEDKKPLEAAIIRPARWPRPRYRRHQVGREPSWNKRRMR